MLSITVPEREVFIDETNTFLTIHSQKLQLEHSLVSVSKWESKWHVPFVGDPSHKERTDEQMRDYIRCMTITQNVDPLIYSVLTVDNVNAINKYIGDPMTATTFGEDMNQWQRRSGKFLTSEYIYYLMFSYRIPKECEKWHLNRLITLIRIFQEENKENGNSKNSAASANAMARRSMLNAQRRAKLHSKG